MLGFLPELLTGSFLFFSMAFAAGVILLALKHKLPKLMTGWLEVGVLVALAALLVALGNILSPSILIWVSIWAGALMMFLLAKWLMTDYSLVGRFFYLAYFGLMISGITWGFWFISVIPVSTLTRSLMMLGYPMLVIMLPSSVIQFIQQYDVLGRKRWLRPRNLKVATRRGFLPKVALHVPTYSEPPELVKQTLTVLSKLDYPNFEVLVIDNNTRDKTLWKPVEKYCKRLGKRFKFIHVDGITGAKAGALNFALKHTSSDVDLIGVIDSDYHADKNFLKSLVNYFEDPTIGFVQTPQDYRGWQDNNYLKMCYWEYKLFFHTAMVSLNERTAAITLGTMCLIRREALEKVGGWAEWCVTEDSELAIRIHANGYSSVYLPLTFGRGLIPAKFSGYKKQRFRWTAGSVQEFKHHFRLLLPFLGGKKSLLNQIQKLSYLNRGLDRFYIGVKILFIPVGFGVMVSMLVQSEIVHVPFELWFGSTVLLISVIFLRWLIYSVVIGSSLKETLGALIASRALGHTISIASLRTIFSQNTPWVRTNKFRQSSSIIDALNSSRGELLLGVSLLVFAVVSFVTFSREGLLLMFLIGVVHKSLDYFSAPLLALISAIELRRGAKR